MAETFLDVTQEAGAAFVRRGIKGPVTMLNLLRFRERADYSEAPDRAPDGPVSGEAAFDRYVRETLPLLRASGGDIVYLGDGGSWLIGPSDERWDRVMLIRQASVDSFLAFASDKVAQAALVHRTAGVADSRLLPLIDRALPDPA